MYPIAHRLLMKCDAVLRLEGASQGADDDVRVAKELGLPVYYRLADVLVAQAQGSIANPRAGVAPQDSASPRDLRAPGTAAAAP